MAIDLSTYTCALAAATRSALDGANVADAYFRIANLCVQIRRVDAPSSSAPLQALAHLEVAPPTNCAPDVLFEWVDTSSSGVIPPAPPFCAEDYHRYGQRAVADDGVHALMHAATVAMLLSYNRAERRGFLWTQDAASLSIYERAAPMQTLLHWALQPFGWQVVHAAAVGRPDGGILLVGNTGAGKSTTALTVLQHQELRYLSDDKCLVRLTPEPQVFALFNSAKLKDDMLADLPFLRALIVDRDPGYKVGKGLAFLHPHYEAQMIQSFPLRAVIIPRIAHLSEPRLTPASASDAFRVLGPSTVIWLPGAEAGSYHFLGQLVRRLPCYYLDLASKPADNLLQIVDVINAHT